MQVSAPVIQLYTPNVIAWEHSICLNVHKEFVSHRSDKSVAINNKIREEQTNYEDSISFLVKLL